MHYGNNFLFLRIYLHLTPTNKRSIIPLLSANYGLKYTKKKAEPFSDPASLNRILTDVASIRNFHLLLLGALPVVKITAIH
jgi:hypothetical protein